MTANMKQALQMAEQLNVTIVVNNEGQYKFWNLHDIVAPDISVWLHHNTVAPQTCLCWAEFEHTHHFYLQRYHVIKDGAYHLFTTLSALCGWLASEQRAKELLESEEEKKAEAQARADQEQVDMYVIRTRRGLFLRTEAEVWQLHRNETVQTVHTARFTPRATTPDNGQMVTARYQLEVSDIWIESDSIIAKLDELSLGVSVGVSCVYGYFNDGLDAQSAAVGIENISPCKTHITEGDFNITSLAAKKRQQHAPAYQHYMEPQPDIDSPRVATEEDREIDLYIHPDMPNVEKEIVLTILDDALQSGYTVTVHDGGETVLTKCSNKRDIFAAMYSTGMDRLYFYQGNQRLGWILLIYGNDRDIVSDYSDNPAMEALLQNADILAETYS